MYRLSDGGAALQAEQNNIGTQAKDLYTVVVFFSTDSSKAFLVLIGLWWQASELFLVSYDLVSMFYVMFVLFC